jgi:hypothetical protein
MNVGFVTAPYTMFEGVHKLPPAHYLWIDGEDVTVRKYWELTYEVTNYQSEKAIVDEFRARLQESIGMHLMSEAPLGALLSGGVDSTAIVTFMCQARNEPFKTFALGFDGHDLSEADQAALSAPRRARGTLNLSPPLPVTTVDPPQHAVAAARRSEPEHRARAPRRPAGGSSPLRARTVHRSGWNEPAFGRRAISALQRSAVRHRYVGRVVAQCCTATRVRAGPMAAVSDADAGLYQSLAR